MFSSVATDFGSWTNDQGQGDIHRSKSVLIIFIKLRLNRSMMREYSAQHVQCQGHSPRIRCILTSLENLIAYLKTNEANL